MFKRKLLKQNKLKRLLLKLLNIYALDKETFELINPKLNQKAENYFKFNNKSILLSSGYLDFSRKIKKLDIYYRFSPDVALWNSPGKWKRIIPNINKEILIKVSLISLKKSILNFLKYNNLNISLNLIYDKSSNEFNNQLKKILLNDKFETNIIKSKINGNRGTYLECCDQAEKSEDLIFFVEDDYIFKIDSIEELLYSYSRITTQTDRDIFMTPSDYVFYYDRDYITSIFIGKNYRWRIVKETLLTFIFSKKILNIHRDKIRSVGEFQNDPFEKPLHEIFDKELCLAPIKSISYHISRTVPSIEPDWLKVWDENYKEINGGP
ncbi:hypothetical protein [Candidatus Pelagibacter sp. HIMB1709]|uniref:hypothetical protein n=1 Tax=Candidatus Pelagibacter sp. HIMB1709 TaxID=3413367 RepID=UPI003F83EA66